MYFSHCWKSFHTHKLNIPFSCLERESFWSAKWMLEFQLSSLNLKDRYGDQEGTGMSRVEKHWSFFYPLSYAKLLLCSFICLLMVNWMILSLLMGMALPRDFSEYSEWDGRSLSWILTRHLSQSKSQRRVMRTFQWVYKCLQAVYN